MSERCPPGDPPPLDGTALRAKADRCLRLADTVADKLLALELRNIAVLLNALAVIVERISTAP